MDLFNTFYFFLYYKMAKIILLEIKIIKFQIKIIHDADNIMV